MMCEDCGCSEGNDRKYFNKDHGHDHPHSHDHDHPHEHSHVHEDGTTHTHSHDDHKHNHAQSRILEVKQKVLAINDEFAAKNRDYFEKKGITAINIISSPGSGKTMLLEKTLDELKGKIKCAVMVGDQQTDNDAKRLEGKGAKVVQIETQSACHLNAKQIASALPNVIDDDTELLFIENVGNLVCPAAFDLGENFKIALLSVTEGEDKPVKYPVLFSDAQIVLLTKTDLITHLDWDMKKCRQYIRQIKPGVFIFELSAKSGEGLSDWINYLMGLVE
jgi:hydrogenase nickel incorporation protein HypB